MSFLDEKAADSCRACHGYCHEQLFVAFTADVMGSKIQPMICMPLTKMRWMHIQHMKQSDFEKQQTPTAETAAAKSTAKAEAAATEESDPGLLDGLLTGLFGGRRKNNANLSNKIGAQMGHNISNKLTKTITDSITRTILGVIKGK